MLSYAAAQPPATDGIPLIPDDYENAAGRINKTRSFPLIGWLLLIPAIIAAGTILLVRRSKHE